MEASPSATPTAVNPHPGAASLQVRRLGWAGIELAYDGVRIAIDPVVDLGPLEPFTGPPLTELPAPAGPLDLIAVTHLHSDHADPVAIERHLKPRGRLLRPPRSDGEGLETAGLAVAEEGIARLNVSSGDARPWEVFEAGPFTLTAAPAVDGFGDPQVSWIAEAGGTRVFHGGDTMFHGGFWPIAMRKGPFDVAFLPINAPICDFPHRQPPSPVPAVLDPAGAAAAARILRAREVVPMHYGTIDSPPVYTPFENPLDNFCSEAAQADVTVRVMEPGETVVVEPGREDEEGAS